MTREELVKQKAHSLGQKYFPNENNVWARANFEAQWVSEACMEMAKWEHKRLADMACDWLRKHSSAGDEVATIQFNSLEEMIESLKKAMEE